MAAAFHSPCGHVSPSIASPPTLMRSVEKLAVAGELAGLSVQDMIDMLNGGLSVTELLEVIVYCLHDKQKPHA